MDPNDIARIAAAAMASPPPGGNQPKQAAQQAAPQPAQQAAPQPPQQTAPQRETQEGQAQTQGAPQTEASKMREAPVVFELPGKDGKPGRKVTASQVEGVLDRYSALNYQHAQMKPIIELAERLMSSNPGMTSADLADAVVSMAQAQQHNPTMGRGAREQVAQQQGLPPGTQSAQGRQPMGFDDEALKRWETENAAQLPPGYRDMMAQMQGLMPMIQQQGSVLQQLLAQSAGVADAARQTTQSAQQQAGQAIRQTIGNNLDRAQQALGLPSEVAQDFMTWSGERGYTLEDFSDGQLTYKVMRDFRNDLMSGEVERLRGVQTKRQSYTGTIGGTPGQGGAQGSGQPSDFDAFANRQIAKRSV